VVKNNVLSITFWCKIKEAGNLKYYHDRRKILRWILGRKVERMQVVELTPLNIKTGLVSDILLSEVK
jgi:hypothetical protein